MSKDLLIKSTADAAVKQTNSNGWNQFNNIQNYVDGIDIGKIQNTSDALFTGMPTPWVRAKFFYEALSTVNFIPGNTLHDYYSQLVSEWKGLMSLLALHSAYVEISEPIFLSSRNEDKQADIFGKMLFEEDVLWTDPQNMNVKDPFIQLIYFRGAKSNQLIGAFSPYSIVFTGLNTDIDTSASPSGFDVIYDLNLKKFKDPTTSFLKNKQLYDNDRVTLFHFLNNILTQTPSYYGLWNGVWSNQTMILNTIINDWMQQLDNGDNLASVKNVFIHNYEPSLVVSGVSNPLSKLLYSNTAIYKDVNSFGFTTIAPSSNAQPINLTDLWQPNNGGEDVVVEFLGDISEDKLWSLHAKDPETGKTRYFSMPFSQEAMQIFSKDIQEQVKRCSPIIKGDKLFVQLKVSINNKDENIDSKLFQIKKQSDLNRRIVLWPNFIGSNCPNSNDNWKDYYVYDEFQGPGSATFHPYTWLNWGQKDILVDMKSQNSAANYQDLVKYDSKRVDSSAHPYSIYKSSYPIAAFSITHVDDNGQSVPAGFVLLNWSNSDKSQATYMAATVGFDFGSNNTCVYYKSGNMSPSAVKFNNLRLDLIGEVREAGSFASFDELLFFPRTISPNGQIKSWVHAQNQNFLNPNLVGNNGEIIGGASVNNSKLHIQGIDDMVIKTDAGDLYHNMKWLSSFPNGLKYRDAFIKDVVLQTKAFLFIEGKSLGQINWSYPSSMGMKDFNDLKSVFKSLDPNAKEITEAEANFAHVSSLVINTNELFVCFDVGGSTTDIMLFAQMGQNRLLRESSVRLAASGIVQSTKHSSKFVEILRRMYNLRENVNIESNEFAQCSKFYINSIFDGLGVTDKSLYSAVRTDCPIIKAVPIYISGFLMFYAGILTAKTIKDNEKELEGITDIVYVPFGKGGRVFMWGEDMSHFEDFYKKCFREGLKRGNGNENLNIKSYLDNSIVDVVRADNKAEVAIGLCVSPANAYANVNPNDICGESDVTVDGNELDVNADMLPEYFENNLNRIRVKSANVFSSFIELYCGFIKQTISSSLNTDRLIDEAKRSGGAFSTYILSLDHDEYQSAVNTQPFSYHQSVLIVEGAYFLDKILMKWLEDNNNL